MPKQLTEVAENSVMAPTRAVWRKWLASNYARTEGIWLVTNKKSSGKPHLSYEEAVEEAICFGWIDSKTGPADAERSSLWMAPRSVRSGWSKTNKARVEKLLREGLMAAPGLEKVEQAKRNGTWSALDEVEQLIIPQVLQESFARHPGSEAHFLAFPRSVKRAILEWISTAKTEPTRTKRVEETARLAAKNERANQWRPKA